MEKKPAHKILNPESLLLFFRSKRIELRTFQSLPVLAKSYQVLNRLDLIWKIFQAFDKESVCRDYIAHRSVMRRFWMQMQIVIEVLQPITI